MPDISEVIEENQGSVSECSGTTEADAVEFSATAIKGGTAKIKETSGGMKLYSITITSASPTAVEAVAESKALYQTISEDLKKVKKMNITEGRSLTVEGSKKINETTIYKSPDVMESLDLMHRMMK